jgi:hypothetical protein
MDERLDLEEEAGASDLPIWAICSVRDGMASPRLDSGLGTRPVGLRKTWGTDRMALFLGAGAFRLLVVAAAATAEREPLALLLDS